MTETLAALRARLARAVGRYFVGTATGGTASTIIDTSGLARWTEDDALIGGWALITAAGGAAPEDESRRISDYAQSTKTVTVSPVFTATVGAGDTYELYLSPLAIEDWNDCINEAIRSSWPELFTLSTGEELVEFPTMTIAGGPDLLHENMTISMQHPDESEPHNVPVLPNWYQLAGNQATGWTLTFVRKPTWGSLLRWEGRTAFPVLATDSATTALDPSYILAAARAEWYQRMADSARGQANVAAHLQEMNHWQERADNIKRALVQGQPRGYVPIAAGKGGKRE